MTRACLVATMLVAFAGAAMLGPVGALGEQASEPGSAAAGQLDAGASFSCAIVTGGQVRCWGYGAEGELGVPGVTTVGVGDTPAAVGPVDLGAGYTATAISSGDYHTCAIRNDGSVVCWGFGGNGRLGYGNPSNVGDTETPGAAGPVDLGTSSLGTPLTAVAISAGGAHTCAILSDGTVRCWGFNFNGELGYGNRNDVGGTPGNTPSAAGPVDLGAGFTAKAISAGSSHTCAIRNDGGVLCWGYGGNGRLGYGNLNNVGDGGSDSSVASAGPVKLGTGLSGTQHTATAVSAGGSHTCAILDDGTVRCWGFDFTGQLGYGNQNEIGASSGSTAGSGGPVYLGKSSLGTPLTAVAITAGGAHTCATLDNGTVLCWGYGASGRLGYGNTDNVGDTPTDTPGMIGPVNLGAGRTATAISAGAMHTCARLDDGTVRCWGYGANGRLGYCSESNVGDIPSSTPDTSGPVNLMPGDGGELCAVPAPVPTVRVDVSPPSISGQTTAGQTLTEAHGSWSPTPTDYAYQWERCDAAGANCGTIAGAVAQTYKLAASDIGSTIRVQETASDGGANSMSASSAPTAVVIAAPVPDQDAARRRRWLSCLGQVSAGAEHLRALTHRGSKHQRARARRRLARRLANGRERCEKIWGRVPGAITGLQATTGGETTIVLEFLAPGTKGNHPPPTSDYLVKESRRPIRTRRDFALAQTLCGGDCVINVKHVGDIISIIVTNLRPHTTYYFVIVARDHVSLRCGPRSPSIRASTGNPIEAPGMHAPARPIRSHPAPPCRPIP